MHYRQRQWLIDWLSDCVFECMETSSAGCDTDFFFLALCVFSGWWRVRRRRVHCERRLHPLRPDSQAGLLCHWHGSAQTGKRNTQKLEWSLWGGCLVTAAKKRKSLISFRSFFSINILYFFSILPRWLICLSFSFRSSERWTSRPRCWMLMTPSPSSTSVPSTWRTQNACTCAFPKKGSSSFKSVSHLNPSYICHLSHLQASFHGRDRFTKLTLYCSPMIEDDYFQIMK